MDCIESIPEIGTRNIYPGKAEKIIGRNPNSDIINEGDVTYDIYFHAVTPDKERIKIIINIEAQRNYYPGYHFVPRGVFYCSRMISEQLETEFDTDNYDDIKKVYSIWLCTDTPEVYANTMSLYSLQEENVYGNFVGKEMYDLLSVIIIGMSAKENADSGNRLIKMLNILLSHKLDVEEKKDILENEYDMKMTKELSERMGNMCNLSEVIFEEAIEKGIEKGELLGKIKMCKEFGLNAQEIAERLNIAISVVRDVLAGKTAF